MQKIGMRLDPHGDFNHPDVEGGIGFEEEGAGEAGSGLEGDCAAVFGRCCVVDGFLYGGCVEGGAVGFGSVVVG